MRICALLVAVHFVVVVLSNKIEIPTHNKFTNSTAAQVLIASAQNKTDVSKLEYLCDTFGARYWYAHCTTAHHPTFEVSPKIRTG